MAVTSGAYKLLGFASHKISIDPSIDGLIDWPTDWFIDWLINWVIDWLVSWLTDWLTDWWIDWLTDWLTDWRMDWLTDGLIDWLIDWMNDWLTTNYRTEVEALVHSANISSSTSDPDAQVGFLTDALPVLETAHPSKLPRLEDSLKTITCTRAVLPWIHSHCDIHGNDEADRMAKLGAGEDQVS